MKNEYKLDEKYICTDRDSKETILNKINEFINQNQSFAPKTIKPLCDKDMVNYCLRMKYKILDEYFFISKKIPSKLRTDSYYSVRRSNEIVIVACEDKSKKILVRRSNGSTKEISTLLSVKTLLLIYEVFVKDVISYQYSLRKLKELKNEVDMLNTESDLLYTNSNFTNNLDTTLYNIRNIRFNVLQRNVSYRKLTYNYSPTKSKLSLVSSDNTITVSLIRFNEMIKQYKSMVKITYEELKNKIKEHYEVNLLNNSRNLSNSIELIESVNIN